MTFGFSPIALCLGDVGGNINEQLFYQANTFTHAFSLSFGQRHVSRFGYRLNSMYGKYAGADGADKSLRNYRFGASVFELNLTPEYVILGNPFEQKYSKHLIAVFAGIGLINSNIAFKDTVISGDFVQLNETALSIPFGLSYQYSVTPKLNIGGELNWRLAMSDFIDGITTKFSSYDDILANFTLIFSYKIFTDRRNKMYYPCNCLWY